MLNINVTAHVSRNRTLSSLVITFHDRNEYESKQNDRNWVLNDISIIKQPNKNDIQHKKGTLWDFDAAVCLFVHNFFSVITIICIAIYTLVEVICTLF